MFNFRGKWINVDKDEKREWERERHLTWLCQFSGCEIFVKIIMELKMPSNVYYLLACNIIECNET